MRAKRHVRGVDGVMTTVTMTVVLVTFRVGAFCVHMAWAMAVGDPYCRKKSVRIQAAIAGATW